MQWGWSHKYSQNYRIDCWPAVNACHSPLIKTEMTSNWNETRYAHITMTTNAAASAASDDSNVQNSRVNVATNKLRGAFCNHS